MFDASLKAKDTWTFYIGHSTSPDSKTGKRRGIFLPENSWLTDWVISNNNYVGIFSCNSSDFAFELFNLANNVLATTEALRNTSTGLEAGAYYTLELLLLGEDLNTAMQIGTGFWAWELLEGFKIEPAAIVTSTVIKK
jgi:hypothetical protein